MDKSKPKRRAGTIIFDDLAFKLTPSERIVFGIIHRFSGYALGECRLKPNKIAELAGVSRSTVYNVSKRLTALGMIEVVRHQKQSGAFFRALRVVKDSLDESHVRSGEFIDELEAVEVEAEAPAPEIQRDKYGDQTINALLEYWLEQTGMQITSRVKANRRATSNLLRQHGESAVRQAIQLAATARFTQFAPSIASMADLQAKWTQLHLWAEKRAHADLMDKYEAMSIEDRVAFKQQNPELAKIITQKRRAM